MGNPTTQRKLRGFLRDAYYTELGAEDAAEAGIAEEYVARVLAFAKEIHELYQVRERRHEALSKTDEAVGALGDVTFGAPQPFDARKLVRQMKGEEPRGDDDPRTLAERIRSRSNY